MYEPFVIDSILNSLDSTNELQAIIKSKDFSKIKEMLWPFLQERCSDEYIIDKINRIIRNKKKLRKLLRIPTIEQRSNEWYKARNGLITSSDHGQALGVGKFGNVRDFFVKKSGYEIVEFPSFIPSLEWGVRYEPVATAIYEKRLNTKVHEFGLLKHPTIPFYGASPDGITAQGVMLEIKCPFKRKIDGKVVDQYYYQMQGQLDVCDLDECDFLECAFHEYMDDVDFDEDWNTSKTFSKSGMEKGIVIKDNRATSYIYSENLSKKSLKAWLKTQILDLNKKYGEDVDFDVFYYRLNIFHVQKVLRNKEFFKEKIIELGQVWNKVIDYRENKEKYDTEIGKKEVKKRVQKCLFSDDVDSID
jgi:putative phage-type endonuclease